LLFFGKVSEVFCIFFHISAFEMVEDYCKSIKNLSCDVLSTIKPTLKISTADAQNCHVFSPYEFTAGTTLLCLKGLNHSGLMLDQNILFGLWTLMK
jgi:hypothetical protein